MSEVKAKKEKSVKEEKPEIKSEKSLHFSCNVFFNGKEYAKGAEWKGDIPKELENYIS